MNFRPGGLQDDLNTVAEKKELSAGNEVGRIGKDM
jgi:hypothetical protein